MLDPESISGNTIKRNYVNVIYGLHLYPLVSQDTLEN